MVARNGSTYADAVGTYSPTVSHRPSNGVEPSMSSPAYDNTGSTSPELSSPSAPSYDGGASLAGAEALREQTSADESAFQAPATGTGDGQSVYGEAAYQAPTTDLTYAQSADGQAAYQTLAETGYPQSSYDQSAYQQSAYQAGAQQQTGYAGYQQPGAQQAGYAGYQQSGYQPGAQQAGYAGYQQPGAQQQYPYQGTVAKSKVVAGILGILLGSLGIHNFYLGYTGKAVAQLLISVLSLGFLAGVSAVWGLVEGILILTAQPGVHPWGVDAQGVPLTG